MEGRCPRAHEAAIDSWFYTLLSVELNFRVITQRVLLGGCNDNRDIRTMFSNVLFCHNAGAMHDKCRDTDQEHHALMLLIMYRSIMKILSWVQENYKCSSGSKHPWLYLAPARLRRCCAMLCCRNQIAVTPDCALAVVVLFCDQLDFCLDRALTFRPVPCMFAICRHAALY